MNGLGVASIDYTAAATAEMAEREEGGSNVTWRRTVALAIASDAACKVVLNRLISVYQKWRRGVVNARHVKRLGAR